MTQVLYAHMNNKRKSNNNNNNKRSTQLLCSQSKGEEKRLQRAHDAWNVKTEGTVRII
jgi:hypothetical protein